MYSKQHFDSSKSRQYPYSLRQIGKQNDLNLGFIVSNAKKTNGISPKTKDSKELKN